MTADAALYKARVAALLSLGNRAGHEDVTFSAVQSALDIPEDQVELFVVRAIGSKLLEGKIDQVGLSAVGFLPKGMLERHRICGL